MRKTRKNLKTTVRADRDSNPRHLEYKAGARTTRPRAVTSIKVYFMTLYLRLLASNELERVWKEAVMA
jgi:hypothetical protein